MAPISSRAFDSLRLPTACPSIRSCCSWLSHPPLFLPLVLLSGDDPRLDSEGWGSEPVSTHISGPLTREVVRNPGFCGCAPLQPQQRARVQKDLASQTELPHRQTTAEMPTPGLGHQEGHHKKTSAPRANTASPRKLLRGCGNFRRDEACTLVGTMLGPCRVLCCSAGTQNQSSEPRSRRGLGR